MLDDLKYIHEKDGQDALGVDTGLATVWSTTGTGSLVLLPKNPTEGSPRNRNYLLVTLQCSISINLFVGENSHARRPEIYS